MKTAIEVLTDKSTYNKWLNELTFNEEDLIIELMQEYAEEYAKEALRLASENATTKQGYCSDGWTPSVKIVDKQSILSEENLPKH